MKDEGAGYPQARAVVFARARCRCEGCGGRIALVTMHAHHRKPRSAGRDDSPANLLGLCGTCHQRAHSRPRWAREVGWIISRFDARPPAEIPALLGRNWHLLGVATTLLAEGVPDNMEHGTLRIHRQFEE